MGQTQVNEIGEIETPILLTSTLSVRRVADALIGFQVGISSCAGVPSSTRVFKESNSESQMSGLYSRCEQVQVAPGSP